MQYQLLRKTMEQTEWKRTAKGNIEYVIDLLKLNLNSAELREFEWKVSPINTK